MKSLSQTQYKIEITEFVKSGAGLLIVAMMSSNVINFLYNSLLGRFLSLEDLGIVTLVNTLWYLIGIFINGISSTTNHKTSFLTAQQDKQAAISFWKATLRLSLTIAISASVVWVIITPYLVNFLKVDDISTLLFFTPSIIFGVIIAANRGFIQGNLKFHLVGLILILESVLKLLFAYTLVSLNLYSLVYLSIPLAIVITGTVALVLANRLSDKITSANVLESTSIYEFPSLFYAASVISSVSSVIFLSLDIILVKHFFDPVSAGSYSLLALVGKMIYFLGSLPAVFMITFVSRANGLRKSTSGTLYSILAVTILMVLTGFTALGIFGEKLVPILFGPKSIDILPYLSSYTLAMSFFTISNIFVVYHLAKKQYIYPVISLITSLLMTIGIIADHSSINSIVNTIHDASLFGLLLIFTFHLLESKFKYISSNILDFIDAFAHKSKVSGAGTQQRVLIFNWRDTKHVYNGGAEVYIHEIAKGLTKRGKHVTLFCGNDGKSLRNEIVEGVNIVRRGGFYTVYIWAFLYYLTSFRGKFDLIIDSHNGIPFFTPLFAKEKIICIVYHIHQDVFRKSLILPLALFACFLERDVMPIVYKNINFITISDSSKMDMIKYGLVGKNIDVVHTGIDLSKFIPGTKDTEPLIVYLGRLKKYKSIDVLIKAFKETLLTVPSAKLVIAGAGEEADSLKRLAINLELNNNQIIFSGIVSENEKINLLQRSWVMVNPSFVEGWGITTIEANACGTPVIGSDVAGLRDSIKNLKTGYLFPYGDYNDLSRKLVKVISDENLRQNLISESISWAKKFGLDDFVNSFDLKIQN